MPEPVYTDSGSLDRAYFERIYADDPDPWDFETSPYERAKYDATLAALPRSVYERALEVGCANGVLTERLAARCRTLLALDLAPEPLARAQARCADLPHVRFEQRALPADTPCGPFDLVVLSEVGYYWSRPDLERAEAALGECVPPGGHLLLVHWTGATHYPLSGDAVHEAFLEAPVWRGLHAERHPQYRLDLVERV